MTPLESLFDEILPGPSNSSNSPSSTLSGNSNCSPGVAANSGRMIAPPPGTSSGGSGHLGSVVGPPQGSGTNSHQGGWSATGGTLSYTATQNMGPAGDWSHYDAHARANPHAVAAQENVLLSKSPMPEFWCSILYFELDTQVSRHIISRNPFLIININSIF